MLPGTDGPVRCCGCRSSSLRRPSSFPGSSEAPPLEVPQRLTRVPNRPSMVPPVGVAVREVSRKGEREAAREVAREATLPLTRRMVGKVMRRRRRRKRRVNNPQLAPAPLHPSSRLPTYATRRRLPRCLLQPNLFPSGGHSICWYDDLMKLRVLMMLMLMMIREKDDEKNDELIMLRIWRSR